MESITPHTARSIRSITPFRLHFSQKKHCETVWLQQVVLVLHYVDPYKTCQLRNEET